jgi:flavin reductase (DIM6/NTAB) family NADH-FMN oxidoreductase RutF
VIIGIAIRKATYSHPLISKTREFVVNIPTVDIIDKVMVCGEVSGRRVDKFEMTGLTPLPAVRVFPLLIAECLINLECKVPGIQEIGDHDLSLGEVLVQHVEEEALDKDRKINFRKLNGFAFNLGEFWTFGERILT